MKKFLGVLLSVCLLLGLTAFPAAASGETSDRVMFVQCDTQNMTANFYFTPNPGAYWSEMGIYTEPQDGWNENSSGKLVRLSNIVPSSLWRVGPSSMTDGDGKVNGTQILDSHFEFTAGVTYYVYMCYYDGANWNVIPDYYSFVFEDGPADGDVFDEDQLILHADMNNTKITTDAGAGSYSEVTFDSIYASGTPDDGCYRRDFNQNVKRNASSTVLGIDNNGGEIGISFQGYRWNGGGTDENFYFTGEAEGCDGIYLISKTGETARAEVEYSLYRYQVIIPAGFDGLIDNQTGEVRHPELWEEVKKLNYQMLAASDIILNVDCILAGHTTLDNIPGFMAGSSIEQPRVVSELPEHSLISAPEGADLIISYFKAKDNSEPYVMLFNKSFDKTVDNMTFTLDKNGGIAYLEAFIPDNKQYERIEIINNSFNYSLKQGEGVFIRLGGDIDIDKYSAL